MISIEILTSLLVLWLIIFAFVASQTGHLLHANYIWKFNRPYAKIMIFYMRIEWVVMALSLKIANSWLIRHSTILRKYIQTILCQVAGAEVYTLKECNGIVDSLFKDYPNVYVGVRICPCRQSRGLYDENISNITDLTFIFSKKPGIKKSQLYTTYISLSEAKRLLHKFEQEGFCHIFYGGCQRYIDGTLGLTICNCRKGVCIPFDLKKAELFKYHEGHNLAVVNEKKCAGIDKCGKCIVYCYFDARVKDQKTGKSRVLADNCYGCGLCRTHCPEGATSLKFLAERRIFFYENLFTELR